MARARALRARTPQDRRTLIGVAGAPGAGKTTLARSLVAGLRDAGVVAAHVPMDGFHLADAALDRLGRRDRKGAPDTFDPAGYAALLARLAVAGDEVWAPAFDRDLEQPVAASIEVSSGTTVVISEGNYLLLDRPEWTAARRWFTETWFVRTDEALRVRRLIDRHVEFGKAPDEARAWVMRSDEANARLVEASAPRADLQVDVPG